MFALNGSPLKGYVIATKLWACRYDGGGRRLAIYNKYEIEKEHE